RNPLQPSNGGGFDLFITKLAVGLTISGRVVTPTGLGLRNAIVALTDSFGVRRTATTSSFGIYSFNDVRTGETYIIGVSSKRYRFASRGLFLDDNLTNVDFVGLE
ncbi:MAG: carboxypeptidase-like regulatory domain-containing protein, partial [Pyrinomonadaceae bacterium]